MTDLTPTPNQLQYWIDKICYPHEEGVGPSLKDKELACLAFKAGADQELEACCAEVEQMFCWGSARDLRTARRPKPPTLKEQALESVKRFELGQDELSNLAVIRRAIEALPND
jgi:hypothetical protein